MKLSANSARLRSSKRRREPPTKIWLSPGRSRYGEYVDEADNVIIDKQYKNIYKLSTRTATGDKFPVSAETLNDPQFWIVFLEATEKTQTPFLKRSIGSEYLEARTRDDVELRRQIGAMIFAATAKDDRNLEKGIVLSFLEELTNCLNDNTTIDALLDDYRRNLQFHSTQRKYYYQDRNATIYSDHNNYKRDVIDAKLERLILAVADLTPIDQIRLRVVLQYYDEIIKGSSNREHLAPLIKRMDKRVDDLKKVVAIATDDTVAQRKNLTIVSLKDVGIQIRKILPLLLCKRLYDEKKAENNDENYLNLIIDEAHNILSEESERESEQWKDYRLETFEEIIKEGRKFGVFVTIASQRPADISPTIISQLHNYFLHRLINNEDIRAVEKTISYLDKVSFEYLPILPTGTCIFAGLLANVPIVVDIDKMDTKYEPRNKTRTLVDKWQ